MTQYFLQDSASNSLYRETMSGIDMKKEFNLETFGETLDILTDDLLDKDSLWVFGYGSILWKTGFQYNSKRVGYITGYSRKFWQGNTTHRGSSDKPGRVATLVPQSNGQNKVWGVAYKLVGEAMVKEAMSHLYSRECRLGGYTMHHAQFYTKKCICEPMLVLVFRATEESSHYLGPAPEHLMAAEIVECEGPSGHNIEYVVLLALYLQRHIPEAQDNHISALYKHICDILLHRGTKLEHFVRTSFLPECGQVDFNNCQNCCTIRNQVLVTNLNCDLRLEESKSV